MMDNFDMAVALIKEAQEQKRKCEEYHEARSATLNSDQKDWQKFYREHPATPKKSIVNDNIKLARRLLLKEYVR